MADKRSRIIYPSQSVWANGNILYRVTSFGSTTTFTTEDLYELGQLNTIDVVDDVPSVAVTIETNCFGDIYTLATMANVDSTNFGITTTAGNAHMVVKSGTTPVAYYHGVTLSDFAASCGGGNSVDVWAPVQDECSLGTDTNNIQMTMFLGNVFVNRLEWSFSSGANATENYTGETDNKTWLLNDGRFVSQEVWVFNAIAGSGDVGVSGGTGLAVPLASTSFGLSLVSGTSQVAVLSDGSYGFLRKDDYGRSSVRFHDSSAGSFADYPVISGTSAGTDNWAYDPATNFLYMPTNFEIGTDPQYSLGSAIADGDKLDIVYAADAYADTLLSPAGAESTRINAEYFAPISVDSTGISSSTVRVEDVGALRQGQIEAYLVDPDVSSSYTRALRLTGVTISADLTRTPLNELGSLRPYDRPVTLPIPFTVTIDTTAADLEHYAVLAGKKAAYDANTLTDVDIYDLLSKDNMKLVIKLYHQTDQEAGGTGSGRKVLTTEMVGDEYFLTDGGSPAQSTKSTYVLNGVEYPLETIVVENLRITDEGYTLRVGDNATQTFGYRGNNSIHVIRGEVTFSDLLQSPGFARNA
mgnify:CR=1 FL=1